MWQELTPDQITSRREEILRSFPLLSKTSQTSTYTMQRARPAVAQITEVTSLLSIFNLTTLLAQDPEARTASWETLVDISE
jgi:hypothetical protein